MFFRRSAFLLLCTASFAAQGQEARITIPDIQSLIRSQSYDQAIQMTREALRNTPSDPRLWTLEGIAFSMKGRSNEALGAFSRALGISPNYAAALKGEVQLLYATQDKRAIPLLRQIVKVDPTDETAHEMLANLERKQEHCQAAIEHFELSADVISTHPESLESYGDCLVETKQAQNAIPVFEKLVALLPDEAFAKYDLALVQVEAKQNDAALKTLQPLLAISLSDPDLLSLASDAHEGMGDTPAAVSLLRQAIVANPSNANLYTSFAALCLTHDSFQVGIDMLNAGIQRIPSDSSLYISRGLLFAQLADYDKAEADFNTAEHMDKKQSLSAYALDLSELQKSQAEKHLSEKQLTDIRTQLRAHPDSALLHYLLAKLLTSEGSGVAGSATAEALHSALLAVKLKPDLTDARDLLASMYLRSNQYELAIEQCRLALQYAPEDQSAIYHLIIALRHSNRASQKEEITSLVKKLSELQQTSLHQETDRKRFRLVEEKNSPMTQ